MTTDRYAWPHGAENGDVHPEIGKISIAGSLELQANETAQGRTVPKRWRKQATIKKAGTSLLVPAPVSLAAIRILAVPDYVCKGFVINRLTLFTTASHPDQTQQTGTEQPCGGRDRHLRGSGVEGTFYHPLCGKGSEAQ